MSYVGYKCQPLDFMVYQNGNIGPQGRSIVSSTRYYALVPTANGTPNKPKSNPNATEFVEDTNGVKVTWSTSPKAFVQDHTYYETTLTIYSAMDDEGNNFAWSAPTTQTILDVDFINSLGITAEKIDVVKKDANGNIEVDKAGNKKIIFSADGAEGNVNIGGFEVTDTGIYSTNDNIQLKATGELFAKNVALEGAINAKSLTLANRNIFLGGGWGSRGVALQSLGNSQFPSPQIQTSKIKSISLKRDDSSGYDVLYAQITFDKAPINSSSLLVTLEVEYYYYLEEDEEQTNKVTYKGTLTVPIQIEAGETNQEIPLCYTISNDYDNYGGAGGTLVESGCKVVDYYPKQLETYTDYAQSWRGWNLNLDAGIIPSTTDKFSLGTEDNKWYNTYSKFVQSDNVWTDSLRVAKSDGGGVTADFSGGARFWRRVDFLSEVYSNDALIHGSDYNIKNTIQPLTTDGRYEKLYDSLQPVLYKFNAGTSGRTHTGLIAQDLKQSILNAGLTTTEVAAYCEWEEENYETKEKNTTCGIRYEELIALNIHEIQKLKKQVAAQEARITELEEIVKNLKTD